ncbi:TetR family transcriptional regulator [Achromobacter xylosoxidans]|uniref:TetR family transcriptional regulator n=1 Tax=Alcaligenes xylosoxydans xylosoxydans TaxID=85698 RepID=A0A9X3L776_ALCXX|nr:TetR/AcrR family transcriptional regulator [Achromobacter xylosoxidans]MCZ8405341.1 TetR family transcriptional regulator [Achromobacter xylosoxidans]
MATERERARLAVSRKAAELFIEHGIAHTSGDDIAAAAGLSKRTVWRYFRSKESCVEPLLTVSSLRFATVLEHWPHELSIEAHLGAALRPEEPGSQALADDVLAVRLIAMLPEEPALRTAWLMACHVAEEKLIDVVARRAGRRPDDFAVRLCAAAMMSAVRLIDEEISFVAVRHARVYTLPEIIDEMARAIRAASTLPICDPIP